MDHVNVLIPKNLDLRAVFPNAKRQAYLDQAAAVIDLVMTRTSRLDQDNHDGWNHIKARTLSQRVPANNVAKITEDLHRENIVSRNGSYRAGQHPMSYRLNDHLKTGVKPWHITGKVMINKLRQLRREESRRIRGERLRLGIHKRLFDDLQRITLDSETAERVIAQLPESKRHDAAVCYAMLRDRRFYATVDKFGHRFHSNLTSLKKELRMELRVDGEPLVEVDVNNSQPLLLSMIIGVDTDDLLTFRQWTETGEFYDRFCQEVGEPRDNVKKMMFSSVFYGPTITKPSRLRQEFDKRFPSVTSHLATLKGDHLSFFELFDQVYEGTIGNLKIIGDCRDLVRPYRNASRTLQRFESQLMIEGVAAKLKESHPIEFIGTVHDCILCKSHMVEHVQHTIQEVFQEHGATPTVTVSYHRD